MNTETNNNNNNNNACTEQINDTTTNKAAAEQIDFFSDLTNEEKIKELTKELESQKQTAAYYRDQYLKVSARYDGLKKMISGMITIVELT